MRIDFISEKPEYLKCKVFLTIEDLDVADK